MYNRKWPVIISLSLLTLTVVSCVKDSLDDCFQWMRIELRWISTQPVDDSESVKIEVIPLTSESEYEITSDIYGVNVNLRVGEYKIVGHEASSNVDIDYDNLTVEVGTAADGMALEPDIFSAGSTITNVARSDESLVIPVPMYRQSRTLLIGIDFQGDGAPLVTQVEGVLSGITIKRNLDNGFPPVNELTRPPAITNGSIQYKFGPVTRAIEDARFVDSKRLLGIDGNTTQVINLDVEFEDGTSESLSFDITEDMVGFHTQDINEPWYIIITLEAGINLNVEIVDWLAGPESWIIFQ